MSTTRHFRNGDLLDATTLADVLTDKKPGVRVAARLMATGFHEQIAGWAEDERERGSDPADIVFAMLLIQVQVTASIFAAMTDRPAYPALASAWQDMIAKKFVTHACKVRDFHEGVAS